MFILAIRYETINDISNLLNTIIYCFLVFCFGIFGALVFLDFWQQFFNFKLISLDDSTVQSTYRMLNKEEFRSFCNYSYYDYKQNVRLGKRNHQADFDNAIALLRVSRQPDIFEDVFFIKLMSTKHDYSRETYLAIKGLSNDPPIAGGNELAYAW